MGGEEIEYGEIRGILTAFASMNNKIGHNYEFNFIREEKDFPIKKLVDLYCSKEEIAYSYQLSEVNDWETKLADCLEGFLFQYFTDKHAYTRLHDSEDTFSFSSDKSRKQYVSVIVEKIVGVSSPTKVWLVDFNCLADVLWQGFIIEGYYFQYFLFLKLRINRSDFFQPKPK